MTRKNHHWTEKQLDYIREKYPTTPAKILAAEMGVTYDMMTRVICFYNIRKHNHRFINDECKCGLKRKRVDVFAYSRDNFKTRQMDSIPECSINP